ncbi:ABC transporter permease subunit [Streptomyces sp. DSM 44915]|uniref:ABC transporter permease subunit n=1 Tax=Streptomyces chisholmiae TaxID=3075540 RepID=A0ABU2JVW4_9ACTN|nr:ABC transporter permease subunit [Streptomyces sp. DSM 44915]MDT0269133.1 ABC transporter permease subunit [Streptomyces sp. DSM 44915]
MSGALPLRLAGTALVLLVWQLVGASGLLGAGIAPPSRIVAGLADDGGDFYGLHIPITLHSAGVGYLWGNLAAIVCAATVVVLPSLEKVILHVGIASACVPLIAVAPILAAIFSGPETAVIMAAVSVFFTTLVSTVNGLRQADRTSVDLVRAYGGGRYLVLRKVRALAALPSVLTALRIAVPAALLGTVIGEFMGQERGLGAALVVAQQTSDVERTWGITLVCAAVALLAFLAVGLAERLVTPWSATAGEAR